MLVSRLNWRRFSIPAVLLAFALATPAFAGEAEDYVKKKQTELISLISSAKADDQKRIDQTFDEILDYDSLSKETLKDIWAERKAEERTEFQGLFKQLVRNAYRKNLKKTIGYEVAFLEDTEIEGGRLVRTVAKHRKNTREEPISLDYRLHQVNGQWRVFDIVTEGSSLVQNYRNQFRRIIKKQGFEELLKRMKSRLEKGDGD